MERRHGRANAALAQRAASAPAPRAPLPEERARVLDWLDRGLRSGAGVLAAEYPLALGPRARAVQRVIFAGEQPAAHALLQAVEVLARGRALRIGLIGSVYSDPAFRGRGFASDCVQACLAEARAQGLPLVLLWSDLAEFYARLGFVPAARDALLEVDAALLARVPAGEPCRAGAPEPADFAVLEALYAAKPVRVHRPAGALARLAAAPATELVVARRSEDPIAYAALGRGDDFRGVVHEWAGDAAGVLACLAALVRRAGPLRLLAGPEPEPPVPALSGAGARVERRPLGLASLLDARELWCAIAPRALGVRFLQNGERIELCVGGQLLPLAPATALELFFGAGARVLADALPPLVREALASALPWPLYVWGFDSV
jgi:predicted N-acetyltransferase YhbS